MLVSYSILLISLLSACSGQADLSNSKYFIPPTLVKVAKTIVYETPTLPAPSPTPVCDNRLTFIEDLSVPDYSEFLPLDPIDKIWLVENSGTCNWEAGYTVRKVGGDALGSETQHALYPSRSGSEAEIQILFTAPEEIGQHQSSWQAFDPQGAAFGDLIFIYIDVITPPTAEPSETETP